MEKVSAQSVLKLTCDLDGEGENFINLPCWGNDRWHDVIVILEDATSDFYDAQLVEEGSAQ